MTERVPDGRGSEADAHARPLVFDIGDVRSMYFSFDGLQSSMRRGQPSALEVDYTKTMMGFLLWNAQPRDILMIGLGGGSLPKFCHHNLAARITVAEINPHIIAARDDFEVPPEGERFHVVQCDGAAYVRRLDGVLDVLLVDGFDEVGQPPQLCSAGFYESCHRALRPDGVMVVNLHLEAGLADALENIQAAFGGCAETVDATEGANCVVFAVKSAALSTRAMSLRRALHSLRREGKEQLAAELLRVLRAFETVEGQRRLDEAPAVPEAQAAEHFIGAALANPHNRAILERWDRLALPDGWLVAGCLFQAVWNLRGGAPVEAGIKDYDLFYFDGADLSEEGERRVQARVEAVLDDLGVVVEAKNQARVHLWYPEHFGHDYPRLHSAREGIDRFLVPATCVGMRPDGAGFEVYAPYGLALLEEGLLTPNPLTDHPLLFEAKARSYQERWPWLRIAR